MKPMMNLFIAFLLPAFGRRGVGALGRVRRLILYFGAELLVAAFGDRGAALVLLPGGLDGRLGGRALLGGLLVYGLEHVLCLLVQRGRRLVVV